MGFDGTIGRESALCGGTKRRFQDLQGKSFINMKKVLTNITESVELAQKLLPTADVPVDAVPLWDFQVFTKEDASQTSTDL